METCFNILIHGDTQYEYERGQLHISLVNVIATPVQLFLGTSLYAATMPKKCQYPRQVITKKNQIRFFESNKFATMLHLPFVHQTVNVDSRPGKSRCSMGKKVYKYRYLK